ncbi:MAG: aminoacyl-tRNA hydrolase [Acidobacteria bacterium]|nr:aminoacyl-tRNA hydrolase [Acidobacteriota bacterium]MCZ6726261.1 aminoacyl-tRNA hydrolase [Acidobacteriota bacterium]
MGLGNPGTQYSETRHNLGFRVIDELARRRGVALDRVECNALVAVGDPMLVQPQTFMNRSGYALRCLSERYEARAEDCLVIYDDVNLPLGRLRFRPAGSPGGHRGMESVINNLRSEAVPRLRLGVGSADGAPAGEDLVEYVLEPFRADEMAEVEALIERAADACGAWLEEEPQQVMNRFNG